MPLHPIFLLWKMSGDMFRVYLLENENTRIYIGLSSDPEKRLTQHNAGDSKWTAKFRPWRLTWQSKPMNLGEARRLENRKRHAKHRLIMLA